ncbi:RNase H domain-containing protein [Caerostris darwini]|uniref:RNase H domain-containing protein n=1 Tax=Caerostris darwini TaxID=1538125 RepID=A0AAV4R4D9_9ARAC|nr:RNase H domain-containing protein [Caerostris darwini]
MEWMAYSNTPAQKSLFLQGAINLFRLVRAKGQEGVYTISRWYLSERPGSSINFKDDKRDQTALVPLSTGHLKILGFFHGAKKFPVCTNNGNEEATPQDLTTRFKLVHEDLLKRSIYVLEVNQI